MNTAPIDLHPTKKRAVSMLDDSAALVGGFVAESFRAMGEHAKVRDSDSSATPISNSEEWKAQLYSDRIKEAMDSDNLIRLATCLPIIQAKGFSRHIAKEVNLLQIVKEVSDHGAFPETVLGPCRSLLESWKDGSNCEDDPQGRSQMQRGSDGEAHDGGAAAAQSKSCRQ